MERIRPLAPTIRPATVAGGPAEHDPGEVTEAEIVARVACEPEAFAALYDRYVGPIYRYCLTHLGSREAAEDATSQVFANALAALPRYRERGNFGGWLFAIARNVITDQHRQRAGIVVGADRDRTDPAPSPEDRALIDETRQELRALLAQLPANQRRAVELRLAGLTGVEVALVLGRSHRAVKMLQFRAIGKLRRLLEADRLHRENKDAGL